MGVRTQQSTVGGIREKGEFCCGCFLFFKTKSNISCFLFLGGVESGSGDVVGCGGAVEKFSVAGGESKTRPRAGWPRTPVACEGGGSLPRRGPFSSITWRWCPGPSFSCSRRRCHVSSSPCSCCASCPPNPPRSSRSYRGFSSSRSRRWCRGPLSFLLTRLCRGSSYPPARGVGAGRDAALAGPPPAPGCLQRRGAYCRPAHGRRSASSRAASSLCLAHARGATSTGSLSPPGFRTPAALPKRRSCSN